MDPCVPGMFYILLPCFPSEVLAREIEQLAFIRESIENHKRQLQQELKRSVPSSASVVVWFVFALC